jgi:TRAP-type C4-dicarboxylate transport system substrate-binding protein
MNTMICKRTNLLRIVILNAVFQKTVFSILTLLSFLVFSWSAHAAGKITFRLGTVDSKVSHSGEGTEFFAKQVSRLSNGSMEVKVFHGGQLGNLPVQYNNVYSGAQDMVLLTPEFLGGTVEQAKILSLPYLFDNHEHQQAFYKSDIWAPAKAKLEKKGAIVLDDNWTWQTKDPRGLISVKPIFTPADMKGFKLRIWEAKTAIETWKGFGANPIVVPRPEMYLAFKQGIIEGGPETIGIAYSQKNMEMAKFWIRTEEYIQINNIMMNKIKFDKLSVEQQNILREAAAIGGKFYVALTTKNYAEKKQQGNVELDVSVIEPALKPWREAGLKTINRLVDEGYIPRKLIKDIRALVE